MTSQRPRTPHHSPPFPFSLPLLLLVLLLHFPSPSISLDPTSCSIFQPSLSCCDSNGEIKDDLKEDCCTSFLGSDVCCFCPSFTPSPTPAPRLDPRSCQAQHPSVECCVGGNIPESMEISCCSYTSIGGKICCSCLATLSPTPSPPY